MNCTHCAGKLRVTHTYGVGVAKYQRAVCGACGRVHTLETTARAATGRGDGARALAARAARSVTPWP